MGVREAGERSCVEARGGGITGWGKGSQHLQPRVRKWEGGGGRVGEGVGNTGQGGGEGE